MRNLRKEFESRGPWVTCFPIDGKVIGGGYHAENDGRLKKFLQLYPKPGRVLELGCLEGGHTFPIAKAAEQVVAIDSRDRNLDRARWLQGVYQQKNISFVQANLEEFDLRLLGSFDVIFNVGLLYHLPEPWTVLERLAPLTRSMFLWTHVAPEELAGTEQRGYSGMSYEEHGALDPLSGMSPSSFWPTMDDLLRMLRDAGFVDCEILDDDADHPNGPAVCLVCQSERTGSTQASKRQTSVVAGN